MTPIGIFDSGFGGLSIFREIQHLLPRYDYFFLGDNARAPYGDRSFEEVYAFTRHAVNHLFNRGCPLVILACNTASAKALRTIQQRDLPASADPTRRVLGVIRPTIERVGNLTYNGHLGLIATQATVNSQSYDLELDKIASTKKSLTLTSHACPRWVPMIERGLQAEMHDIVYDDLRTLLAADPEIDTLILGCTHYSLISSLIQSALLELGKPEIILMPQGKPVAYSLQDYLRRHPEMEQRLTTNGQTQYFTTGDTDIFERQATLFLGRNISATHIAY